MTTPFSEPFLFDSKPIEAWRVFKWGRPTVTAELFELAGEAPAGSNPYKWARLPRLASVGTHHHWVERRPMAAICGTSLDDDYRNDHDAPAKDCSCGLWGVKTEEDAWWQARSYNADLIGRIAMWGRFIEHRQGWRAQYAYPLELFVIKHKRRKLDHDKRAAEVAERYGVPVGVVPFKRRAVKPLPYKAPKSAQSLSAAPFVTVTTTTTGSPVSPTAWVPNPPWPSSIVHPSELMTELVKPEGIIPVYLFPEIE